MYKTAESVSPGHPDKMCDQISDAILDECLKQDPLTRAGIEVMGAHGIVYVTGELTTEAFVDVNPIVERIVGEEKIGTMTNIIKQSPEIAAGVDTGGAGDQGIMTGYATRETRNLIPIEVELSRILNEHIYDQFPNDGKTQVTLKDDKLVAVVCSWCHVDSMKLTQMVRTFIENNDLFQTVVHGEFDIFANPAGDWDIGGFWADTGLTGRKIVVDNYGPRIPVGGGCFSGKEPMKVDRSAAYKARQIAVRLLNEKGADEVYVQLAYAIGKAHPVSATALIDGTPEDLDISDDELTPNGIIESLDLQKPQFEQTARYGHFGRGFSWDS